MKERDKEEEFKFDPLTLRRVGRYVSLRSNWRKSAHKKFMTRMRLARPELRKEIDDKIEALLNFAKRYDPFDLLAPIAVLNLFADAETYTESRSEQNEPIVEYLLSIVTALSPPVQSARSTPQTVQKVLDLLREIQEKTIWYYASEFSEERLSKDEVELRARLIFHAVLVRGSSYPQHEQKRFLEMLSPHDKFMGEKLGFTSCQFLEFVRKVLNQLENNVNNTRTRFLVPFKQLFDRLRTYADKNREIARRMWFGAFKAENKQLVKKCLENLSYLQDLGGSEIFRIDPTSDPTHSQILESISIRIGENKSFLRIKDFAGWFLNPSIIYEKPLIKYENSFYCFCPQILLRNMVAIVETLIKKKDKEYWKRYVGARSKYLEKAGIQLLSKILKPNTSLVHRNLRYDGFEIDGLIEYDDVLFLIEARTGKLSERAKRGSTRSYMDRMKKELLGKAYEQGNRAIDYITRVKCAKFCDERGNQVLEINRDAYRYFFPISLYLEPIGHIVNSLSFMQRLGVVGGKRHWAVYVDDLRVISEIMDHPTLFIHYLMQHGQITKHPQLLFLDELDIFMLYLREGLYFQHYDDAAKTDQLTYIGYTEDLDNYYLWIDGKRTQAPKPSLEMPRYFKSLIDKLELKRPRHFTSAALALLECDDSSREEISKHIERCEAEYKRDYEIHSITLIFKETGLALLLSTLPTVDLQRHSWIWGAKHLHNRDIKNVVAVYWSPEVEDPNEGIHVFLYERHPHEGH